MMVILVALGIGAVGVYLSAFIVQQYQQALVLEFGKPKRIVDQAGLHWKLPIVETVEFFDKRILDLDTTPQERSLRTEQAHRRQLRQIPDRRPAALLPDGAQRSWRSLPCRADSRQCPAARSRLRIFR